MITKKQLKEHLMGLLLAAKGDPEQITSAFTEHLQYSNERYAELDDEAKVIVDKQFDVLDQFNEELVKEVKITMPDSERKRVLLRKYRKIEGSHFDVRDMLKHLEGEAKIKIDIDAPAQELFIFQCQIILDFLCDITAGSLKARDLPIVGLFFAVVEEAYISFFLAQHRYAPQSMSHTRHILEALNLIDLFQKDISYMDLWASDDWQKKKEQLSPAAVREKLGQHRYDPVYGLLSEIGSHSSFKYIQTKIHINAPEKGKKQRKVRINLEGVPQEGEFHIIQAYVACIVATSNLFSAIIRVYKDKLFEQEVLDKLGQVQQQLSSFMEKHYQPLMKEFGMESNIEEMKKL